MTILTTRQEQFCVEYVATRSFGRAYRAAYRHEPDMSDKQADQAGRSVWLSQAVKDRVKELMNLAAEPVIFNAEMAIRRFLAIADADVNELISVQVGCCRRCWGEGHRYQWREYEYAEALEADDKRGALTDIAGGLGYDGTRAPNADCPACHGRGERHVVVADTTQLSPDAQLLYGGVEQTRNGIKVIVADRIKALENACKLAGLFTDNVRVSGAIASMTAQVSLEQLAELSDTDAAKAYQRMIAHHLS